MTDEFRIPTDVRSARASTRQPFGLRGVATKAQSLNRFAYVENNPCNSTDPSGLSSSTVLNDGSESAVMLAALITPRLRTCSGHFSAPYSTVDIERRPSGFLDWSFDIQPAAQALLGYDASVTMPLALVNGWPINPPYPGKQQPLPCSFHSSMNTFQWVGRRGGRPIQTGDLLTLTWFVDSAVPRTAFSFFATLICIVGPPGP